MQREEQLLVARRLLELIDTQGTDRSDAPYRQPVEEYISPGVAGRERQRFFRDQPLCVGLSADLPAPGSYRTHDLSGQPLLLVRTEQGQFRAFLNVCRHRGARVAEGCGEGRGFTCPYHAWVFGLNGDLVNRPDEDSFDGLPRSGLGLTPLAAQEHLGLLWVCPTPGHELDAAAWLGASLTKELEAYGLGGFNHYASREITRSMNWKLVVDTFLESYHFCVLHRDSICSTFYQNLATFDSWGSHFRLVSPRRSITTLPEIPQEAWQVLPHTVVIYVLFPSTVVVWQGEQVELWQIFPGSTPDEAVMRLSLYSPEPALTEKARRHWDRNFQLVLDVVQKEDFPLGEGVQRGFRSTAQSHLVFGRNEPALAHYHREITRALGA